MASSSGSLVLWVLLFTLVLPPHLLCLGHAKPCFWPSSAHDDGGCLSWRVMVEANNARGWRTVPAPCVGYVRSYMRRGQYGRDLDSVMEQVSAYVDQIASAVADDGLDAWIFDIDDTCLSNLLYYEAKSFGCVLLRLDRPLNYSSSLSIFILDSVFQGVRSLSFQELG